MHFRWSNRLWNHHCFGEIKIINFCGPESLKDNNLCDYFKNGHLFHLFSSFQGHFTNFTKNRYVKNVHPVYSTGIRTHNLGNISLLPYPLDQGSRPFTLLLLLPPTTLIIDLGPSFSFCPLWSVCLQWQIHEPSLYDRKLRLYSCNNQRVKDCMTQIYYHIASIRLATRKFPMMQTQTHERVTSCRYPVSNV